MGRRIKKTTWDGRTYWEDENGERWYEDETWDGRKYRENSKGHRIYEGETWNGRKYWADSAGKRKYEDEVRRGTTWNGREYEEDKEGWCFLTTACVKYAGLSDNCPELQTMRRFRDEYIKSLPEGSTLIDDYYRTAPLIIQRIKSENDPDAVFKNLLTTLRRVVALIQADCNSKALLVCKKEFEALKERYGL